jgi:hypothetical protein
VSEKLNPDEQPAEETPAEKTPADMPAEESGEAGAASPGESPAPSAAESPAVSAAPPMALPPSAATEAASPAEAAPTSPGRGAWLRGRAGVIGAGLALALVAGFSGFALAHVTDDRDGDRGDRGTFHGERHGRHGGDGWMEGPGGRGQMPGMAPDQRPDFDRQLPDDSSDSQSEGTN